MKKTMALALGLVAATATTALAEVCTSIDGVGETRPGVHRMAGTVHFCDNGDGYWHFDFYNEFGSLFLDGRLIFFNVL